MRERVLLCVMVFIVVTIFLNYRFKKTKYFINEQKQIRKYLDGVPHNMEIVNIGSAHAKYAMDYSDTKYRGFNFALQSQTFSYDYNILKQYVDHLKTNCVVLIFVSPLNFAPVFYAGKNNVKYYYFMERQYIEKFSFWTELINIDFPVFGALKTLKYILKDTKPDKLMEQWENPLSKIECEDEAELMISVWKQNFSLTDTQTDFISDNNGKSFEYNIKIVSEIIEYCLNRNLRPVFVIPPVTNYMNSQFSEKFLKSYVYDNIMKANTCGVPVLDYFCDDRFSDQIHLFVNSEYLNQTGRTLFTKILINDLIKEFLI